MGNQPIVPYRPPTQIEQAKLDYVAGRIDVETLERVVEHLLSAGVGDDRPTAAKPAEPTYRLA